MSQPCLVFRRVDKKKNKYIPMTALPLLVDDSRGGKGVDFSRVYAKGARKLATKTLLLYLFCLFQHFQRFFSRQTLLSLLIELNKLSFRLLQYFLLLLSDLLLATDLIDKLLLLLLVGLWSL